VRGRRREGPVSLFPTRATHRGKRGAPKRCPPTRECRSNKKRTLLCTRLFARPSTQLNAESVAASIDDGFLNQSRSARGYRGWI
jgi:hypothetical protein